MKKKIALITFVVVVFLLWWNQSRLQHRNPPASYNSDKKALIDTLISWKKFQESPTHLEKQEWWIDTLIYNNDTTRLFAIFNSKTDDAKEVYNFSKLLYGIRNGRAWNFYTLGTSLTTFMIDKKEANTRASISQESHRILTELYHPFTIKEREDFWKKTFYENEADMIRFGEELLR